LRLYEGRGEEGKKRNAEAFPILKPLDDHAGVGDGKGNLKSGGKRRGGGEVIIPGATEGRRWRKEKGKGGEGKDSRRPLGEEAGPRREEGEGKGKDMS